MRVVDQGTLPTTSSFPNPFDIQGALNGYTRSETNEHFDFGPWISARSLRIDYKVGRANTCSFDLVESPSSGELPFYPQRGAYVHVRVHDWNSSGPLTEAQDFDVEPYGWESAYDFFGFVDTVEEVPVVTKGEYKMSYKVSCVGVEVACETIYVTGIWEEMNAYEIFIDLLRTYLPDNGFWWTHIPPGSSPSNYGIQDTPFEIDRFVCNHITLAEAFDRLCEITGYIWGWSSPGTTYFTEGLSGPALLDWGTDPITEEGRLFPYVYQMMHNIKLNRRNNDYRNVEYITGGTDLTSLRTETFVGDGFLKNFQLGYPVSEEPTAIEVNGTPVTFGKSGDGTFQFYWSEGDRLIRQDDGAAPLSGTDELEVTYIGRYNLIVERRNEDEVDRMAALQGVTDGVIEHTTNDTQIQTLGLAVQNAEGLLAKHSVDGIELTITGNDQMDMIVPPNEDPELESEWKIPFDEIAGNGQNNGNLFWTYGNDRQEARSMCGGSMDIQLSDQSDYHRWELCYDPETGPESGPVPFICQSVSISVIDDRQPRMVTINLVNFNSRGDWITWFRNVYRAANRSNRNDVAETILLSRTKSENLDFEDSMSYSEVSSATILADSEVDDARIGYGEIQ
jgi:hypothetical protein